jgi:hypothetical protein
VWGTAVLGSPVGRYNFLNEPENIIWLAGRKGNVPHRPNFPLERDHNPRMLKEIERSAVSITNKHEMYPCSTHPQQQRQLIEITFFNR